MKHLIIAGKAIRTKAPRHSVAQKLAAVQVRVNEPEGVEVGVNPPQHMLPYHKEIVVVGTQVNRPPLWAVTVVDPPHERP